MYGIFHIGRPALRLLNHAAGTILQFAVIGVVAFLAVTAGAVEAETISPELSGLEPFRKKTMPWQCRDIGAAITLSFYCDESVPVPERGYRYGVIYFVNGNYPRIGSEPDEAILRDFLTRDGHWVIVVDLKNHPKAKTPDFDNDMLEIYRSIYKPDAESILSGTGLTAPKFHRIFLVPAGYRLATDLVYYDLQKYAAPESLNITMQLYNELADRPSHREFHIRKVERPEDMVDMHGKPLDYLVRYDIIYPGRVARKVPLFVLYNSGWENAAHYPPDTERINLANFLFRGYAYANVHYPFSPVYKAFECNAHRDATEFAHQRHAYFAAIRKLRLDAAEYNFDVDRIGFAGVSKSAPVGAILADPTCEAKMAARKPAVPQPWPGVSAQVACVAMFNGNMSADFLRPGFVPAFYGRSELDAYVGYWAAVKVRAAMEKANIPHIALIDMSDLPHTFPRGRDRRLGNLDLDWLFRRFFDHFLEVDGAEEPELVFHLPLDGQRNLAPAVTPELYFLPAMQPDAGESGRTFLLDERGGRIAGKWRAENGGLRFRFTPDAGLSDGTYRMVIGNDWKSVDGKPFRGGLEFSFTVDRANAAVALRELFPVASVEKRGSQVNSFTDFKSYWPVPAKNQDGTLSTLTYDLGREFYVALLAPQFAQTRWEYYFDVEISVDGASWRELVMNGRGRFAEDRQEIPVGQKIRYIRLTAHPNPVNHLFLTGIRILGY